LALPDLFKNNSGFILQSDISPDSCGPSLVALQGTEDGRALIEMAQYWAAETQSPLTRAWIKLGLRLNGVEVADAEEPQIPKNLMAVALDALAARDGNYALLKVSEAKR
jgi:hypothetical protein